MMGAPAARVDVSCQQLLAGSGLSCDGHGAVGARDGVGRDHDLAHRPAFGDDLAAVENRPEQVLQLAAPLVRVVGEEIRPPLFVVLDRNAVDDGELNLAMIVENGRRIGDVDGAKACRQDLGDLLLGCRRFARHRDVVVALVDAVLDVGNQEFAEREAHRQRRGGVRQKNVTGRIGQEHGIGELVDNLSRPLGGFERGRPSDRRWHGS